MNLKHVKKYLIEGIIIAITAFYIPILFKSSLRKPTFTEIFIISIIASLSMYLLDEFSDKIALVLD